MFLLNSRNRFNNCIHYGKILSLYSSNIKYITIIYFSLMTQTNYIFYDIQVTVSRDVSRKI